MEPPKGLIKKAYLAIYCHAHPEDWKKAIPMMEFTHNNRRHADRHRTPFELMQGESPKALPSTFTNTKFPAIDNKLRQLIADQEEALAAHELARTRIAERKRICLLHSRKDKKFGWTLAI